MEYLNHLEFFFGICEVPLLSKTLDFSEDKCTRSKARTCDRTHDAANSDMNGDFASHSCR